MTTQRAVPYWLAALAMLSCTAPASAQFPTLRSGIFPIDEAGVERVGMQSAQPSAVTPAQAVLLDPTASPLQAIAVESYASRVWELQVLGGAYFKSSLGPEGPNFDYLPFAFRLGRMWDSPRWDRHWLLGSFETLIEVNGAAIASGPGNVIIGPSLILRRNILWRPDQRCVPYIQGGAGIIWTDAGNDREQDLIGQDMEFLLQAQVGLRTHLGQNWSFDVEGGYQHISNAGLAIRNGGVNNFGASIGFTYTFGCRR